jgi:hypothetical protein
LSSFCAVLLVIIVHCFLSLLLYTVSFRQHFCTLPFCHFVQWFLLSLLYTVSLWKFSTLFPIVIFKHFMQYL